ncbi:hypothetical protein [Mangrovivirga cuniculi]|uniref:Lipocalin-like domain-containing protein n=1 Tax=Mangrovivirga cuniculi TaxID=2715131 RepID=A0A4D7JPE0_9BACT|nr:hypothetical protein [Mangrovivirga cuniculi]QCK16633.1 hypothetical protein DCC35_18805 [Mangrovivirga cuniculi]
MNFSKLLSVFFLSLIIFSSCSDDENTPSVDTTLLPGDYTVSGYTEETSVSAMGVSQKTTETYVDGTMTVSFTAEPNAVTHNGSFNTEIIIPGFDPQSSSVSYISEFDGDYTVSGNKITFGSADAAMEYQIVELTETTLRIKYQIKETQEIQGFETTTEIVREITLASNDNL